jgi:hypothetical protein
VSAAVGDVIKGKLKTAICDRSDRVIVPESTVVTARILKIRRFYGFPHAPIGERRTTFNQQPF